MVQWVLGGGRSVPITNRESQVTDFTIFPLLCIANLRKIVYKEHEWNYITFQVPEKKLWIAAYFLSNNFYCMHVHILYIYVCMYVCMYVYIYMKCQSYLLFSVQLPITCESRLSHSLSGISDFQYAVTVHFSRICWYIYNISSHIVKHVWLRWFISNCYQIEEKLTHSPETTDNQSYPEWSQHLAKKHCWCSSKLFRHFCQLWQQCCSCGLSCNLIQSYGLQQSSLYRLPQSFLSGGRWTGNLHQSNTRTLLKIKVKPLAYHEGMGWRGWSTAPLIPNLGTRWRWVVSFTL